MLRAVVVALAMAVAISILWFELPPILGACGRDCPFDGGDILSALVSVGSIVAGAWIVGWQIRRGFQDQKELIKFERHQRYREEFITRIQSLSTLNVIAGAIADGLGHGEPSDRDDQAGSVPAHVLQNLDETDLFVLAQDLAKTEDEALILAIRKAGAHIPYLKSMMPTLTPKQVIAELRKMAELAVTALAEFDRAFPKG
ncbi:hypothetical protein [Dongia sp.]|uniref:hypothetical protein n=1 Tax=Dongia sp. TaxID=1977262 RepID=UPI0035AF1A55